MLTECSEKRSERHKNDRLFDQNPIFLTSDKNLRYQQNLAHRRIAIIMLPTNRWPAIMEHIEEINLALAEIENGDFVEVEF